MHFPVSTCVCPLLVRCLKLGPVRRRVLWSEVSVTTVIDLPLLHSCCFDKFSIFLLSLTCPEITSTHYNG
ncbi:hypothetical protein Y032_0024g925 [Ancylostoma ceylanicum]|uniref:Uncharacterized protein n=1 Tax=Ancylostoma ceylanicum TaxID=53326 RepID=A0A016UXT2_9BILA|nr:hypothetical protein Y032_0024g925 [Ancylostoma ceylanicum]